MKHCWKCNTRKEKSEFHKDKSNFDGLSTACRPCESERSREYYRKHRNKVLKRQAEYWKTPRGKEVSMSTTNRMMDRYPEKLKTRNLTRMYVKMGKIKKKPCEICGDTKVEAHHTDYSDAINVHWYCPYHHRAVEGRSVV